MAEIKLNGRSPAAVEFRTERVIAAARELAIQGGYEAVQMRAVAARAKVALATLYRYYGSKDVLLTALIDQEISRFATEMQVRPSRRRTAAGRAADTYIRAFRGMTRDRGFAHAIMTSYHAPIAFEESQQRAAAGEVLKVWPNEFHQVAATAAWGPDRTPTPTEYRVLHMLEALWASSSIMWLNSSLTTAEVERRINVAAEAMVPD